jgi:hypothetical protein
MRNRRAFPSSNILPKISGRPYAHSATCSVRDRARIQAVKCRSILPEDAKFDVRFAVWQPLDRRRPDRRSRHRRRDAEVQCADRGRGDDRDHAAGESPGGLRQNDVGQGPLSHGPHDAIVITGTSRPTPAGFGQIRQPPFYVRLT